VREGVALIFHIPGLATGKRGPRLPASAQCSLKVAGRTVKQCGKGWSMQLRLQGPRQPWFDKTWRPGDPELVDGPEYFMKNGESKGMLNGRFHNIRTFTPRSA